MQASLLLEARGGKLASMNRSLQSSAGTDSWALRRRLSCQPQPAAGLGGTKHGLRRAGRWITAGFNRLGERGGARREEVRREG